MKNLEARINYQEMDTYYIRIEPLPDSESTKPSREHRYTEPEFLKFKGAQNDSYESIPQAWRAGTTTLFPLGS
jgi:hypothetical protein